MCKNKQQIYKQESQIFKTEFMLEMNQKCYQAVEPLVCKIVKITKNNIYFDANLKFLIKTKKKKFDKDYLTMQKNFVGDLKNELLLTSLKDINIGKSFRLIPYKVNSLDNNIYINYEKTIEYLSYQRLFYELEHLRKSEQTIRGYILNTLNGGFSVGIGGLVAFVPNNALMGIQRTSSSSQNFIRYSHLLTHSIMDFKISNINFNRNNVVLTRNNTNNIK